MLGQTLVGGIGIQLTLLVTGVVIARALGPEDRGNFALLTLVWAIAGQLGGLGIPYAVGYFVARRPAAALRTMREMRAPLRRQLAVAVLATAVVLVALTLNRPSYVQAGAILAVLAVAPSIVQQFSLATLQGLRRFTPFNIYRVLPNTSFAVLAGVLLAAGSEEFMLFVAGWAASRSIWAPLTLRAARRAAEAASEPGTAAPRRRDVLSFGRKALFGASPPLETYRLDQSVVALFLPPAALGLYVVSLAFTNLPRFIAQSFGLVANPTVAAKASHREAMKTMWKFSLLALPFYLTVIAALWVGAPELTRFFFGPEFETSAEITRILLLATGLFCARRVLTEAARGAGFPTIGSIAEIAAFVGALPLLAIFVPLWGAKGVAWALIGSSALALAVLLGRLWQARQRPPPREWAEATPEPSDPTIVPSV